MQCKTLILTSFLGLAAAASSDVTSIASELPSCSTTCLSTAADAVGCSTTDYSCQCDSQTAIAANASSCLSSSCSVSNIATTQSVLTKLCAAVDGTNTTSSTVANSTATGTSTSSSSTSSNTGGSSAGSRPELYLSWMGMALVAGLMATL